MGTQTTISTSEKITMTESTGEGAKKGMGMMFAKCLLLHDTLLALTEAPSNFQFHTVSLPKLNLKTPLQQQKSNEKLVKTQASLDETRAELARLKTEVARLKNDLETMQEWTSETTEGHIEQLQRADAELATKVDELARMGEELATKKHELATKDTTIEKLITLHVAHGLILSRDLSNGNEGDPERGNYGVVTAYIKKSVRGNEILCQMFNTGDDLVFEAIFPNAEDAHNHMYLTVARQNSLTWIAYDTSQYGSQDTNSMVRRFTVHCDGGAQLLAIVTYGFGGNYVVLSDFMNSNSRFYHSEETHPPLFTPDGNRMEVDGEEDMPVDPVPLDENEAEDLYGDVNYQTQDW